MLADLQVGQHAQSLQPNTSLISAGSNPTLHRRIAAVPEQRSHQEKQHSQRTVARFNRLRSVLTPWVMAGGQGNFNGYKVSEAMESGAPESRFNCDSRI